VLLPASFAATEIVTGEPVAAEVDVEVRDKVEPVIWIGMDAVAADPVAATVIVAVRLSPVVPAEKVIVAFPVASVVTDDALICPVDAVNVSACPDKIELPVVKAVAVRVTELVPSLFTLLPVVVSEIVEAVDVAVVAAVVTAVVGVFPQPAKASSRKKIAKLPIRIEAERLINSIVNFLFRACAQF
jgi:hypothetical protein